MPDGLTGVFCPFEGVGAQICAPSGKGHFCCPPGSAPHYFWSDVTHADVTGQLRTTFDSPGDILPTAREARIVSGFPECGHCHC